MKYLIVNADDFALSRGVTLGILEAHASGVVTSASFLVDTPDSDDAARLARHTLGMSFGLHADVPPELIEGRAPDATERCRLALERQIGRFEALMGRPPTHLDSHHNAHRHAALAPAFREVAARHGLPLREHSAARYFSRFYGRWGGDSHPEQIAVPSLARMLETEMGPGLTELSCHPGHPDVPTGYFLEREAELRTLSDPRVPEIIARLGFVLVSYHDYRRWIA